MKAKFQDRLRRLDRLVNVLPSPATAPSRCLDGSALLSILAEAYGNGSLDAKRRALQRDLADLVEDDRVDIVNPNVSGATWPSPAPPRCSWPCSRWSV